MSQEKILKAIVLSPILLIIVHRFLSGVEHIIVGGAFEDTYYDIVPIIDIVFSIRGLLLIISITFFVLCAVNTCNNYHNGR